MVDLSAVLERFTSGWSDLIGLPAWNAIRYRKNYQNNVEKIVEYVLDVSNGGADILINKKSRNLILWKLREDEAIMLAEQLSLKNTHPIYKCLAECSYGGKKQKILFDFS